MAGVKVWPAPAIAVTPPPVWDVRHAALGQLPAIGEAQTFLPELRNAAARVLVAAGSAELVFVGRSPEPLYYYLLGLLDRTDFKLTLCNISLRWFGVSHSHKAALRGLLGVSGLQPHELVIQDRRLALVDVVASGSTFNLLAAELFDWAEVLGVGSRSVRRRVRFVGLTHRESGAWTQLDMVSRFQTGSVRLDWPLWNYLGNSEEKVAPWHPPQQWQSTALTLPDRDPKRLQALANARALVGLGQTRAEVEAFVAALNAAAAQRFPCLRQLSLRLREKKLG